jgi:uncharacterized protein (TIGR02996 family)
MPRPELLRLLEACKAEPHDDTVRLALGDWLDEHGGDMDRERAAFVRFQLASTPENGGTGFIYWMQRCWEARAADWLPSPCVPVASQPVRGLIQAELDPRAALKPGAEAVAASEAWAWVEQVRVPTRGRAFARLLASPLLDRVPSVDLTGPLSDTQMKRVAASLRPAWRNLSVWPVGQKGVSILLKGNVAGLRGLALGPCVDGHALGSGEALPTLDHLSLPAQQAAEPWAGLLRRSSWRLRSLALVYEPTEAVARAAAEADSCAGLRSLRISSRAVRLPLRDARFWASLEELDMDDGGFPARGIEGLAEAVAPRLRRLSLGGTPLDPAEMRRLAEAPAVSALDRLDLSGSPLGPQGAAALAALPAAPCLLNLCRCRIGDKGLKALAAWPGLTRCRELWLTANGITDAGLRALAASPHAAGLAGLVLYANRITDAGASRLLAAGWVRQLQMLELRDNRVTEAIAPALLALRGGALKELGIGLSSLSARTRHALKAIPCIE